MFVENHGEQIATFATLETVACLNWMNVGGTVSIPGGRPSLVAGPASGEEAQPVTGAPLVGIVGPCGAGKSTLAAGLRALGIRAREVAQEHSYVPAMWQRITRPDLLVYLDVSRAVAQRRLQRDLPVGWWEEIRKRLAHARAHADLMVQTDPLTPEAVLERVLEFLEEVIGHEEDPHQRPSLGPHRPGGQPVR